MSEIYVWVCGVVVFLVSIAGAWFSGHSKGKTTAEAKASEDKSAAVVAAAERQTTVSKEAAHVDQNINNLGNDDVDKQLLDKWTR